jgi:antitoxin component of RelBE/YafQ-DinJ toxin-antitoxin module
MLAQTSMFHVRLGDRLKAEAAEALAAVSLTVADAGHIPSTRVAGSAGCPPGLQPG